MYVIAYFCLGKMYFMSCDNYQIKSAVVLTNDNLRMAVSVAYMPIYMLMFIWRFVESKPQIVIPDLTGLV